MLLAFAVIAVWDRFNEREECAGSWRRGHALSPSRWRDVLTRLHPERRSAIAWRTRRIEGLAAAWQTERLADDEEYLDALYSATIRKGANGSTQSPVLAETFKQLDVITQARRSRLHLAKGIVPGILWTVLFCGAILTVTSF